MPTIEVLTLSDAVPVSLLDRVLTATEQALHEAGAEQIWITRQARTLTVMAELPADGRG